MRSASPNRGSRARRVRCWAWGTAPRSSASPATPSLPRNAAGPPTPARGLMIRPIRNIDMHTSSERFLPRPGQPLRLRWHGTCFGLPIPKM